LQWESVSYTDRETLRFGDETIPNQFAIQITGEIEPRFTVRRTREKKVYRV